MKDYGKELNETSRVILKDWAIQDKIANERRIAASTINLIWIVGIISTGVTVYLAGWIWSFLLLTPVVLNALITHRAYIRISHDLGISSDQVHECWRSLQKDDLRRR